MDFGLLIAGGVFVLFVVLAFLFEGYSVEDPDGDHRKDEYRYEPDAEELARRAKHP